MDNNMARGGGLAWKAVLLLFAAILMVLGPPGCSRKSADEGAGQGQADKVKSGPVAPGQDSLAKPQGSPNTKTAPENSGKQGEDEDQEEPESESEDD